MAEEKYPQFSEDSDVARAKAFWKENGKPIMFGIGFGLVGIAGFNYWDYHQQNQGEQASNLYQQVLSATEDADAQDAGETLKTEFGTTIYASLSSFLLAKTFVEDKGYEAAIDQFEWVLANSEDESIKHIARLRLALVHITDENPQAAIELLTVSDMGNFTARYQEILGDAHVKRNQPGDSDLARSAYQNSLDQADNNQADTTLLQLKLQNVGEN